MINHREYVFGIGGQRFDMERAVEVGKRVLSAEDTYTFFDNLFDV